MSYYRNEAYDLSLFEDRKNKPVVEIPDNETVKKEAVRKQNAVLADTGACPAVSFRTILNIVCVSAVVLLLVFVQINCLVKTTETTAEINAVETEIERLNSEKIRLEMELDAKVSFENIEQAAKDAGMQKPVAEQMRYININDTDKVEIVEEKNLIEKFFDLF